jgi:hypothetical protein
MAPCLPLWLMEFLMKNTVFLQCKNTLTGGKFAAGAVDIGGEPWLANISKKFSKKIETTLILFSRAWGKMIHEKNLTQKIS